MLYTGLLLVEFKEAILFSGLKNHHTIKSGIHIYANLPINILHHKIYSCFLLESMVALKGVLQ
jgi:hypothetical protein